MLCNFINVSYICLYKIIDNVYYQAVDPKNQRIRNPVPNSGHYWTKAIRKMLMYAGTEDQQRTNYTVLSWRRAADAEFGDKTTKFNT